MWKKLFIFTALFLSVLPLSGKNNTAVEMNSILASVNGEVISLKDVLLLNLTFSLRLLTAIKKAEIFIL